MRLLKFPSVCACATGVAHPREGSFSLQKSGEVMGLGDEGAVMLQVPDIKVRINSNPALSMCNILLATSKYVRMPERVRIRLKVSGIVFVSVLGARESGEGVRSCTYQE